MTLLLTILSVLAAWAFLHVLMVGLLLIFKVLDSIVRHLQQIAMGVRAIEQQTKPIGDFEDPIARSLGNVASGMESVSGRLSVAGEHLERALPVLKSKQNGGGHA